MRFSTIFTVWSLKSLLELIRSFFLILLMNKLLKIWFCQLARCSLLFLKSLLRSQNQGLLKSDWAISKSDVPSTAFLRHCHWQISPHFCSICPLLCPASSVLTTLTGSGSTTLVVLSSCVFISVFRIQIQEFGWICIFSSSGSGIHNLYAVP